MDKKYTIGDKIFIQRPLVLGQLKQLLNLMKQINIPQDLTASSLVTALGDQLFIALAIVLTEEGQSLRDKDIPALADDIEFSVEPMIAISVINDFFLLNPIASLLNAIGAMTGEVRNMMEAMVSMKSLSSCAPETSQNETTSSGDIPSGTASPG